MSVGAIKGTNKLGGNAAATEGPRDDAEDNQRTEEVNASASKKRHFNDITQISLSSIPQRRSNPFAKSAQGARPSAGEPEQISSATKVQGGEQLMADGSGKAAFDAPANEGGDQTAIEKEWQEVKRQNELERA